MGKQPALANHVNPSTSAQISSRIAVYWPLMQRFYPGTVTSFSDGKAVVVYDDGDKEYLVLANESWEYITDENKYHYMSDDSEDDQPEQTVRKKEGANQPQNTATQKAAPANERKRKNPRPRQSPRKIPESHHPGKPEISPAKRQTPLVKQRGMKRAKLEVSASPTHKTTDGKSAPISAPRVGSSATTVTAPQPPKTVGKPPVKVSKTPHVRSTGHQTGSPAAPNKPATGPPESSDTRGKDSGREPKAAFSTSKPLAKTPGGASASITPSMLQVLKAPSNRAATSPAGKPAESPKTAPAVPRKDVAKQAVPGTSILPRIAKERSFPRQENSPVFPSPAVILEARSAQPTRPAAVNAPHTPVSSAPVGPFRQLARPIVSGVPLSERSSSSAAFRTAASQSALMGTKVDLHKPQHVVNTASEQIRETENEMNKAVLRPLTSSCGSQLDSQVGKLSGISDALLILTRRVSDIDDRCKVLRADVDNMESEATSRAEINKLLSHGYSKHISQLQEAQTKLLATMKNDLREFIKQEIMGIEEKLMSEFKKKSVEVFSKLFEGAVNSIDGKDVMEDSTSPSRNISTHTVRRIIDECEQKESKRQVARGRGVSGKHETETGSTIVKGGA